MVFFLKKRRTSYVIFLALKLTKVNFLFKITSPLSFLLTPAAFFFTKKEPMCVKPSIGTVPVACGLSLGFGKGSCKT